MHAMKKTLIATLLAATSASALAATTTEVKVIGTITPVACTPSLGGGGTIDYGNISANSLKADDYTLLPVKEIALQIICDAPVAVAIKASSQRPSSVAGATEASNGLAQPPVGMFGATSDSYHVAGLGLTDQKRIGGYAMRLQTGSALLDGQPTESILTRNNTTWAKASLGGLFASGGTYNQSWMKKGDSTVAPMPFKEMVGNLQVQAYINKSSELPVTKAISLDGLASIELVYL